MTGSVPCPECGNAIPSGRLACPSCGHLLASVRTGEPAPDHDHDADAEGFDAAADAGSATVDAADDDERLDPDLLAMTAAAEPPAEPEPDPEGHHEPDRSAPTDHLDADDSLDPIASGGVVPGAYLPPSTVHRPGSQPDDGGYAAPAPPAYQAPRPPAWQTPAASSDAPSASSVAAAGGLAATAPAAASAARPVTPGKASLLADLPFDAPDELEGWLVAFGAGTAILGFFLPWHAALDVGLAGYLGSWGLGISANLPIFVLAVVTLALALLPNRVAEWVRTGVLGMVGGGIIFGVVWLYIGAAAEIGAILAMVGGILLVAGGILAVAPGRMARRNEDA